jgi:NAD(P)H-flavin reductase
MSDLHEATLTTSRPAADGLAALSVDVAGTPLVGSHANAGQYVKLALPGYDASYFAIASAPSTDGSRFDLLVKRTPGLAGALAEAPAGSKVMLSTPLGKGFPLERANGKNVLLIATGSGISPIRSAIEALRKDRAKVRDVTLYWGARTPRSFPYEDEWIGWEKDDIRLVRTVSQPSPGEWSGPTGYVQAHLDGEPLEDTVAFLVGQKAMVEAAIAVLEKRGLTREHAFTNY